MLKDEGDKKVAYTIMGIGALVSVFAVFKYRAAKAATKKALLQIIPRGNKRPEIEDVDIPHLARTGALIPGIVFTSNEKNVKTGESKDASIGMKSSSLNFTPRSADTLHDERLNQDLEYLKNTSTAPPNYFETFKKKGYALSEIMHPNDFQILQASNIIPTNFPFERIEIVKSLNGKNLFMVGYSEPKAIDFYKTQTKSENDKVKIIKPLWAVSFGKVFNPTATVADDLLSDKSVLKILTTRVLVAEGMTARANEGCSYLLDAVLCAAEKVALMGIYFKRYRGFKSKNANAKITAPIYKEVQWNSSPAFMSVYNGWMNNISKTETKDKRKITNYPEVQRNRVSNFYDQYMWSIPDFGNGASNYVHVDTMINKGKLAPKWIWTFRPLDKNKNKYTSKHPILVGKLLASDNAKDFY